MPELYTLIITSQNIIIFNYEDLKAQCASVHFFKLTERVCQVLCLKYSRTSPLRVKELRVGGGGRGSMQGFAPWKLTSLLYDINSGKQLLKAPFISRVPYAELTMGETRPSNTPVVLFSLQYYPFDERVNASSTSDLNSELQMWPDHWPILLVQNKTKQNDK